VALAIIGTGALLYVLRADELRSDAGVRSMILGLQSFTGRSDSIEVLQITLVGTLVAGVVVTATMLGNVRRCRGSVFVALFVLSLVGGARTRTIIDANLNAWATAGAVQGVRGGDLPTGAAFRFKFVPDRDDPAATYTQQRQRAMLYQFYLPGNPMSVDGAQPADLAPLYVFAPIDDVGLTASGAEVVWRDPVVPIGLWVDAPCTSSPGVHAATSMGVRRGR
jgi:hypothetical protein